MSSTTAKACGILLGLSFSYALYTIVFKSNWDNGFVLFTVFLSLATAVLCVIFATQLGFKYKSKGRLHMTANLILSLLLFSFLFILMDPTKFVVWAGDVAQNLFGFFLRKAARR